MSKRLQVIVPEHVAAEWQLRATRADMSLSSWIALHVQRSASSFEPEVILTLQDHEQRIAALEERNAMGNSPGGGGSGGGSGVR